MNVFFSRRESCNNNNNKSNSSNSSSSNSRKSTNSSSSNSSSKYNYYYHTATNLLLMLLPLLLLLLMETMMMATNKTIITSTMLPVLRIAVSNMSFPAEPVDSLSHPSGSFTDHTLSPSPLNLQHTSCLTHLPHITPLCGLCCVEETTAKLVYCDSYPPITAVTMWSVLC